MLRTTRLYKAYEGYQEADSSHLNPSANFSHPFHMQIGADRLIQSLPERSQRNRAVQDNLPERQHRGDSEYVTQKDYYEILGVDRADTPGKSKKHTGGLLSNTILTGI